MRAVTFTDEYDLVAPILGREADALRAETVPHGRWYTEHEGRATAVATARLRPDDRLFVRFDGADEASLPLLADLVAAETSRPLFTMCDHEGVEALERVGFEVEVTTDRFEIPFALLEPRLRRAWVPTGYAVRSVTEIPEDEAFDLDNRVRDLVPGTDGWRGNRAWFAEELQSPEFDASAYLVAIHRETERSVGLIRIWRNATGPRLGLLALLPDHRAPSLAAALLTRGVAAAASWGHEVLHTETSAANAGTYPGLLRMGLEPVGRFHQLRRDRTVSTPGR